METWRYRNIGDIWTWRHGHGREYGHEKTCVIVIQIKLTCTTNHGKFNIPANFSFRISEEFRGI
jgi:hypothetical protein